MIKTSTPKNDFQTSDLATSQPAWSQQNVSEFTIASLLNYSRSLEAVTTANTGALLLVNN